MYFCCLCEVPKYDLCREIDRQGRYRRKQTGKFDVSATRNPIADLPDQALAKNLEQTNEILSCLPEKSWELFTILIYIWFAACSKYLGPPRPNNAMGKPCQYLVNARTEYGGLGLMLLSRSAIVDSIQYATLATNCNVFLFLTSMVYASIDQILADLL